MAKITITKLYTFEAAHQLPGHAGKCVNLHGHSYKLEVTVAGPLQTEGSSAGMVVDFSDLTALVEKEIIQPFDHKYLNEIVTFRTTVENLAQEIFARLTKTGLAVTQVRLWESPKAYATVTN